LAAEDDIAHFVVVAVERVHMGTFRVNPQAGGKPQYDPRLMLALRQRHLLVAGGLAEDRFPPDSVVRPGHPER
jgi:hypothetical protein